MGSQTHNQSGIGVNAGAGSKSPSQQKAPTTGAPSLKPIIQPDAKAVRQSK